MDIPLFSSSFGTCFASDLIQEEMLQQEMIAVPLSHTNNFGGDVVSRDANFDVDTVRWLMDSNDSVVSAV